MPGLEPGQACRGTPGPDDPESAQQWTEKDNWSGLLQVDELIHIARVSVFFIDDRQVVRPGEVGSSDLVRKAAATAGARVLEFELDAQFRCGGSDGLEHRTALLTRWVHESLQVASDAEVLLNDARMAVWAHAERHTRPWLGLLEPAYDMLARRYAEEVEDGRQSDLFAGGTDTRLVQR